MSKKLIKAVYYTRVSTNKQEQEQSFEAQEAYFKELLSKENGYELVCGYCEKGISGTKLSTRTEFNRMLEDAGLRKVINKDNPYEIRKKFISYDYVVTEEKPKFEMIFVKDNSRLARNTDIEVILKKLKIKGVYVYFVDLNRNNKDSNDDMYLNMLFSHSQHESIDKSNKVRFGALQSAKNGKIRCGNQLYGYTYNKEKNTLRIIENEAEVVKKIFELRAEGNGTRKICNYLKEQGIKTRKGVDFRHNVISRMLQNPTYTGKLVRNKYDCNLIGETGGRRQRPKEEWIINNTDKVDKIIDDMLFDKVQELISNNISKLGGIRKGKYISRTEFAEKIICSKCGKHYTRNTGKLANGKTTVFYNCATKKQHGVNSCNSRNIKSEEIENMISFYLKKGQYKKTTKEYMDLAIQKEKEKKASLYIDTSNEKEIEEIDKKIESHKGKLKKLMDIYLEDDSESAKEIYDSKKNEIDSDIKVLEKRRKELTLSQEQKAEIENKINKNIQTLIKCYEQTPEEITRDEFIKNYLECFVVSKNGDLSLITMAFVAFVTLTQLFNKETGVGEVILK